jgi:hypothetical protein
MAEISPKEHIESTAAISVIAFAAFFGGYSATDPTVSNNGLTSGDALAFKGTIILAVATLILAIGTFLVWRATVRMAQSSEEASKRQLRAYVYLPDINFVYDGPRSQVKYAIKNFGHTPAHKVTIQCLAEVVKRTMQNGAIPNYALTDPTNVGSLAPNGDYFNDAYELPFATIVKDDEDICFAGCVTYLDIHDSLKLTNFRYFISGKELNELYRQNNSTAVTAEMYAENEGNDST